MIVDLTDTTAAAIAAALVQARHTAGVPAVGMVLTLVIVTNEGDSYDALRAALEAAHEHPSRVLVTILRPGKSAPKLDAEVRFLGDSGPGETVVMRLHGELAAHAESVLLPLLLPDAPVVAWWPGQAPDNPALDHYELRYVTGPKYSSADEIQVANIPAGTTTFATESSMAEPSMMIRSCRSRE